ncbi:MAG: hypothetical protein MMC33_000176 [Icmadophila ericetorum]|nr:hypothetical protein [Icmadophila ericetorum]
MDIATPDDLVLKECARDGSVRTTNWQSLLERLLERIDYAVHNEFPIPSVPLPQPLPRSIIEETPTPTATPHLQGSSFSDDSLYSNSLKENNPPDGSHAIFSNSATSLKTPNSEGYMSPLINRQRHLTTVLPTPAGALPPQLLSLLSSIHSTLKTSFAKGPPHTIQRLAELALHPSVHYRTLPSYLRAIDRVISVSSTADTFPLPSVETALMNGDGLSDNYLSINTRQDDFNGAALTRIPWLRDATSMTVIGSAPDLRTESTAMIDGPNGAGSLETVTVSINNMGSGRRENGGLRSDMKPIIAAEQLRLDLEEDGDERTPHARGPEEIGVEDMGPQSVSEGFDIEAALGRKGEGESGNGMGMGMGMGMSTLTSGFSTEDISRQKDPTVEGVAYRDGEEKEKVEPECSHA